MKIFPLNLAHVVLREKANTRAEIVIAKCPRIIPRKESDCAAFKCKTKKVGSKIFCDVRYSGRDLFAITEYVSCSVAQISDSKHTYMRNCMIPVFLENTFTINIKIVTFHFIA